MATCLALASMRLTARRPRLRPQVVRRSSDRRGHKRKVVETQVVEKLVEATAAPEAKPVVTWFQYDQGNVDPKSDERVGNQYLRDTIPQFNKAFEGKWVWNNEFTPWDRAAAKIVAAVQASAEVPDLIDLQGYQVNQLLQERHDAGPDRVGEGAVVVLPDGRKRAEDVHGPRR